jgi:3-oxoacyl-[acyl-carrier protein] reductase
MDLGLHGRTALVTASYRGTGRGIARVLASEGAHVVVHGFDQDAAEVVAAELRATGGSARAVAGDLLTDAGADALADAVGPVAILVANYGVADGGSWFGESTDEAAWFGSYNKNVLAAVRLVRRCTPAMRAQHWGRIVFLGTVGSLRPGIRQPQYYAAATSSPSLRAIAPRQSPARTTASTAAPPTPSRRSRTRPAASHTRFGNAPAPWKRPGRASSSVAMRASTHWWKR